MENFTKASPELQKLRVGQINERWGQLHALEKEWSEKAVQYLFLTNAGGAAAMLGFLGASETAFSRAGAKWSLAFFVLGLILVGFVIANTYYRMSGLFKDYKREVEKYFHDQISWEYLDAEDDKRAEDHFFDHLLPWASFALFIVGCIVGGFSLFG